MTKQQALDYKERYRKANEFEIEELRRTSIETKLRQLAVLFSAAREMGWAQSPGHEEEEVVWQKWQLIRKRYKEQCEQRDQGPEPSGSDTPRPDD